MTQKVKKFRSEKHLKFIRSLPCIRCCSGQSQAAHIRMFTDGGTSLKPSDNYTVPLCHKCHQEQHQIGELAFWGSEEKIRALIKFTNALVGCGASGKYGHDVATKWIITKLWRK